MTNKQTPLVSLCGLALALLLSACGSKVALNPAPVVDLGPTGGTAAAQAASSAAQAAAAQAAAAAAAASRQGGGEADRSAQAGSTAATTPPPAPVIRVSPLDVSARSGPAPIPADLARIIYFDYDSFEIKPQFEPVVQGHARYLNANKGRKIALEGHTDERGGREYNLSLGQKRAEAVRQALSVLGVDSSQMDAVSFGQEKPAVAGSTPEAYEKNRRVEFTYR